MKQNIVILHNAVQSGQPDQLDVIHQRDLVMKACAALGHKCTSMTLGKDLKGDMEKVLIEKPDVVFNLVEDLWDKGELIYVAPALLNAYKLPYTGVPLDALFLTTSKVLAKKWMRLHGLPTADFLPSMNCTSSLPTKLILPSRSGKRHLWASAQILYLALLMHRS